MTTQSTDGPVPTPPGESPPSAPSGEPPPGERRTSTPVRERVAPFPVGERPALAALLEAVLMVAERPVGVAELATGLGASSREIERLLPALAADYVSQGRGFRLRHVGAGWRFYTADECAPWVERFVLAGQSARLTQAALETLAVVAYQQPVSRGRIGAVRGVSADGVIRTLTARRLVEEVGHDRETGAILYGTTDYFLERLGLRSLDELPPLAPLLPGIDDLDGFDDPMIP